MFTFLISESFYVFELHVLKIIFLELKISDMDEWMDSSEDDSSENEENNEDEDKQEKKKKAKKGILF